MSLFRAFSEFEMPARADHDEIVAITAIHGVVAAAQSQTAPLLVVTASSRRTDELETELASYLGSEQVINFPPWETLPHEKLSPKSDTIATRFTSLHRLASKNPPRVVVTSIRGLLQPIIADLMAEKLISLEIGQEIALSDLAERLAYFGYTRTDLVEKRGDFAVRGGIVDIFAPDQEHPIRIDFFGDDIEEIAFFTVADQRTFAPVVGSLTLLPCRELLLSDEVKTKARYLAAEFPVLAEMANKIAEGISVDGMESLAAMLKPEMISLLSFLPKDFQIAFIDYPRIRSRAIDLVETNKEFLEASWSNASMGGASPISTGSEIESGGYFTLDEIIEIADNNAREHFAINAFQSTGDLDDELLAYDDFQPVPIYGGKVELATADIHNWLQQGYQIIFVAPGPGLIERYQGLFRDADIPERVIPEIQSALTRDAVHLTLSPIEHGFINDALKIAFITEKDISGQRNSNKDSARMPSRRKKAIDPLELKPGDYIVHEQHGVGRYIELIQRTVGGVSREYLVIEYASSKRGQPADRLFVPTDTLEQITKYVGGEAPALHRIGGADWQNAKRRARKAVKQIAAELIQLYAARMSAPGYAFSPDTASRENVTTNQCWPRCNRDRHTHCLSGAHSIGRSNSLVVSTGVSCIGDCKNCLVAITGQSKSISGRRTSECESLIASSVRGSESVISDDA